jgi:hypothetical protein
MVSKQWPESRSREQVQYRKYLVGPEAKNSDTVVGVYLQFWVGAAQ